MMVREGTNLRFSQRFLHVRRNQTAHTDTDPDADPETETDTVRLVGCVEDKCQMSEAMRFWTNDSTDRIKTILIPTEERTMDNIDNGMYVSIVGELKITPPHVNRYVVVHSIRPVISPDEISCHMIEAAHAALKRNPEYPS